MNGTLPEQVVAEAMAWAESGTAPVVALDFGSEDEATWAVLTRLDRETVFVPATGERYPRRQIAAVLRPALDRATALDARFRLRIPDDLTRLHLWLLTIGDNNLSLLLDDGITVRKHLGTPRCTYDATRGNEQTEHYRLPHEALEAMLAYGTE